jgi:hypothetical protein
MKVSELIKQLSACPQDSKVYLWVDGERIPAHSVDDSFVDEQGFIEINADTISREFKS